MKLKLEDVTKKYNGRTILDHLNVEIDHCQMLTLLGPSGSGKSTLLRTIAGLEIPDEGTVTLDDKKLIYEEKELVKHRRELGVVFQSWNLFPHMTALENISLPLYRVHDMPLEEAHVTAIDLLKRFDLADHAYKKPAELSGGQNQRVALIRAVAVKPKLLLLDEPTSALDPLMTAEVLELIMELKNDGKDFILVTHHLNFARKAADFALFMADGKIIETGTVEQLFTEPKTSIVKNYVKKVLSF